MSSPPMAGMNRFVRRRRLLLACTTILILMLAAACGPAGDPATEGTSQLNGLPFDPVEPAPDFTLTDQDSQPFRLSEQKGTIVLLYFGFTNCPDECPATMSIWKQVADQLGEDADKVRFVMISVDPDRDTPEVLGNYLANFNSDFIGLSGPVETLEDVAFDYTAYFKRLRLTEEEAMSAHADGVDHVDGDEHEHESYLVAHTTLTYVIDEEGQLIMAFPLETPAEAVVSDLEFLIGS